MAKLYFHYAAMNAGKSTTLIQASFNYQERGMRTIMYTAAMDDREAKGVIASRIGIRSNAFCFSEDTNFFAEIKSEHETDKLSCIFVDEAQFLSKEHVLALARVVDELSIPVLCYGLRTDFRGELFPGSAALLAIADELKELKTICECGAKATMTLRIDGEGNAIRDGDQVEIGGDERYIALCRKHYFERYRAD